MATAGPAGRNVMVTAEVEASDGDDARDALIRNTAFPAVFLMGNGPILDIRVREIFGSVPSSPFMLPLPGCRLFNILIQGYTSPKQARRRRKSWPITHWKSRRPCVTCPNRT